MHPWILGVGLTLAAATGAADAAPAAPRPAVPATPLAPAAACPAATAPVHERFIAADCLGCWATDTSASATRPPLAWTLDWMEPRSDDAPLSAAALPEAAVRHQRHAVSASLTPRGAWPRRARLTVESGPAWQGYFGLRLGITTPQALPAGASGWLALVEHLPARSEGSAVPRWLVRNVAGPLPLDALQPGRSFSHLTALRWPDGARPERLRARGWIETPAGHILAMAADRCD